VGESNIIDVLVKNIRKKLGNPSIIQTKRGMGYVFKNEESD
ncbi:MAG: winged helix-turn-helix domain-containing protein, partial [Streptococcus parasanguinis]|nr:winged helix-turn-helix domain-containing protein [Streptococcus parasanguinis]